MRIIENQAPGNIGFTKKSRWHIWIFDGILKTAGRKDREN